MANELVRANKVTIKMDGENYVADFYRTHKKISTIKDIETGWDKPQDATRTGERESFRAHVIQHADAYGIDWKPEDMRTADNIRQPRYKDDDQLISDAIAMITPDVEEMADRCRYGVTLKSIDVDNITPMQKTSKGTPLSALGIIDGKYEKSGNWAWATIDATITLMFKDAEVYHSIKIDLASGQLKKPKLTITEFTESMNSEIIGAGLATADELDPPKEDTKPAGEPKTEIPSKEIPKPVEELIQTPKPEEVQIPEQKSENIKTTITNKSGRVRTALGKK